MKAKRVGAICAVVWVLSCKSNGEVVGDERDAGGSGGAEETGGASGRGAGTGGSSGGARGGTGGATQGGTGAEQTGGGGTGALGGDAGAGDEGGSGGGSGDAGGGASGDGGGGASGGTAGGGGMSGRAGSSGMGGAGAGAGGTAGGGGLCGGVTCATGLECCGPPECGYCYNPTTDPGCATSCPAPNRPCGPNGLMCRDRIIGYPGEVCVERVIAMGPLEETTYACLRDPCFPDPLDCTCAAAHCAGGAIFTQCTATNPTEHTVRCTGGGPCVSPDTPIATPEGERPIAELRPGDLVYGLRRGALDVVPVLRVSRTPVTNHHVVRVRTRGGALLEVSELHPTADGRTFADLAVGDALDGDIVVSRELISYSHPFTVDILPASDDGSYVASGVLIGTTLGDFPTSSSEQCEERIQ